MKPVALGLVVALVLPALPARADAPRDTEASYRELERASGLDLSNEWESYSREKRSVSFAGYAHKRFRVRRNAGFGLAAAGGAVLFVSIYFFCFGYTGGELARGNTIVGATGGTIGAAAILSGAVLAGVYSRRMNRLEDAAIDLGNDARELARRPGDLPVNNGGLGLRFAF